jgi:DNA polymerase III subunit alpha
LGEVARGLPVRLAVLREGAQCELQLDDRALFFPTDAALASWTAQAHERRAEIVFN